MAGKYGRTVTITIKGNSKEAEKAIDGLKSRLNKLKQKAINDCPICNEKGLVEADGKLKPCNHGKI